MRIALFPGCFDPFHQQHLTIVQQVAKREDIDSVWILINDYSEEKNVVLTFPQRYEIIKKNLQDIDSKIQLFDQPIGFYTTDLIQNLKAKNPDWNFVLILGSDQINNLSQWKKAKNLEKLVDFIAVERQNYKLDSEIQKKFKIDILKNIKMNNFNSSEVKQGKNWNYLTPASLVYIHKNLFYYNNFLENNLSDKRLEHSYNVAELAKKIARYYNFPTIVKKVFVAGLIHDLTKEWTKEQHLEFWKKHQLDSQLLSKVPEAIWHSWTSAHYLEKELCLKDQEIINAIYNHTTGKIHMSNVEQIVFVADKLEKNKNTNVENNKLRKQLFTDAPFAKIFTQTLNNVYSKLLDENKKPGAAMKAAWQHYCQKKT